jgi:glycolate oxidase FAD binding subunit
MTPTDLAELLQAAVPGARVLTGGGVDGYEVDSLRPAAVVQPADADEVAAVVRFAAAQSLALTARGGGSMIDLGNVPARLDLVLEMTRLDRILEHHPQDLTVTVEAGITVGALQRALAEHGQMLALDPPLMERATVGGVLAADTWGPRRQRYGTARDLLIGSRAVLADGTRLRAGGKVVKNVAGYDLNKLLIGSLGTLGVITEATFKVAPLPAGRGMIVASFPTLEAAHAVALEINRGHVQPLTLDLIGPPAARRLSADSRAEPADGAWLLAVELGGTAAGVERATRDLVHMMTGAGSPEVTALELGQRERLLQRLRDFGRSPEDLAGVILRLSVRASEVAAAVRALARATPSPDSVICRAGSGTICGYWEEIGAQAAITMVEGVRRALAPPAGSVVVEKAPGGVKRQIDVWGLDGPDVELMRRIKSAYDPAGTLSPGRLVS